MALRLARLTSNRHRSCKSPSVDAVDVEWALAELRGFIELTILVQPPPIPGVTVLADRRHVKGPASAVVASAQVVQQILDRVLPDWRSSVPEDTRSRWQQERQAAQRVVVQLERAAEVAEKLGDNAPHLNAGRMHPWAWEGARSLWQSGHYREAVRAALVKINAEAQNRLGRRDLSETTLFQQAYSTDDAKARAAAAPPARGRRRQDSPQRPPRCRRARRGLLCRAKEPREPRRPRRAGRGGGPRAAGGRQPPRAVRRPQHRRALMPVTVETQARVLRWAHVVDWQVNRLVAARTRALESSRRTMTARRHGPADNHPFHELDAEKHFTMTAARQLLRALKAFDGDDRIEGNLDRKRIRTLRDALEHWDTADTSRAWADARQIGVDDPESHQWSTDGTSLLGGLVADDELQAWARAVYQTVLEVDPFRR